MRALTVCSAPSCPRLAAKDGRCPLHVRPPHRHLLSATQRGYGEPWRRLAATILARDAQVCGYCGAYATTVDHRLPKRRGGGDDDGNLVACCVRCNSAKQAR